ncbi:MAG TPA: PAS domain-containing protein, partial [Rhizomicrobium sp.]|nr:PAS domain-containing protein [Rhizomicrobium sp.]
MSVSRSLSEAGLGVPTGAWRWASLAFVLLALAAAALTIAAPQVAGLAGYALLLGIAMVAVLFVLAVWPRGGRAAQDALRIAEAAGKANIAWAITGEGGAVLDCNPVYRRMAGVGENETPPPPELALAGEPSAAVLYRLSRDAAEGRAREETFQVLPGLEIVAAVRPLPDKQAAWWFTPRLAASTSPQPNLSRASRAAAQPSVSAPVEPQPAPSGPVPETHQNTGGNIGDLFRDAPMGVAFADAQGLISDANAALAKFFGVTAPLAGRNFADLVDAGDRSQVMALITRAAAGEMGLKAIE